MSWIAAFLGAAIAAALLSHLALRVGWVDQREGQEHRKLRRQPVALVGGAVLLIGVATALVLSVEKGAPLGPHIIDRLSAIAWPGLLAAFFVGLADDLAPGGLAAGPKFAGQFFVAALVTWYPGAAFADASALECVGLGLLALIAMNAVNLFDHADGLVGVLCVLAMGSAGGPMARLFAASAAGYLPFNLFFRRPESERAMDIGEQRQRSAPYAMLGDSGSHLVGVLIATTPGAWWFLAIPLLDMGRVVLGRLKRGDAFWRGDRTHIGHLLADIGFAPVTAAALVGLAILPPLVTMALMEGTAPLASGLMAGAALYFGMLVLADGALGEGGEPLAPKERSLRPWRTKEGPGGLEGEPSLSDVFARASGKESGGRGGPAPAEDDPLGERSGDGASWATRILWPRKSSSRGQNGHPSEGGEAKGAGALRDAELAAEKRPQGSLQSPSEPSEDASGPFAGPLDGGTGDPSKS